MSCLLQYLPEDIFRVIQTFLLRDDYHYFLNSGKILGELKRKTIYFTLNLKSSERYCHDIPFQRLLISKVDNGWNQIAIYPYRLKQMIPLDLPTRKIYFSYNEFPLEYWNNYKSIKCHCRNNPVERIPVIKNVEELCISNSQFPVLIDLTLLSHLSVLSFSNFAGSDLTPLKNIPDLCLYSFQDVTNFSMFTNQKSLVIMSCCGLTDVTSFRFIRKLKLFECHNLIDVSPLNSVYDLSLIACLGIKDISGLGNHRRLFINHLAHSVNDFICLLHIPHVTLINCNIKDVSVLQYAKSVDLKMCYNIRDVSALRSVKKVKIFTNNLLSGFQEMNEVPDLSLRFDNQQKLNDDTISNFKNKRLSLSTLDLQITSLSVFSPLIEHLTLIGSATIGSLIEQWQGLLLSHLSSLRLDSMPLSSLEGLGGIPTVKLSYCQHLRDLQGLGRNRCVKVVDCQSLEDVSSLATVPIVTIKGCKKLTEMSYECLKNVPRLKVV